MRSALAAEIEATLAIDEDVWERAAAARLLIMLEVTPGALLLDEHPGVRACAALSPGNTDNPLATQAILEALLVPNDIDNWFGLTLPGRGGRLRFELIEAAVQRVRDFDRLLPVALAVFDAIRPGRIFTFNEDIGPFLDLAFTSPYSSGESLTVAQRRYLSVLVEREDIWNDTVPVPWFKRAGLPYDREACIAIIRSSER